MERIILAWLCCFIAISYTSAASEKLLCYYHKKAQTRKGEARMYPQDIRADMCTDLVYAFAEVDDRMETIQEPDEDTKDDYRKVTSHSSSDMSVLLAIGGPSPVQAAAFASVSTNDNSRRNFAQHVHDYINSYNFDGVVIHWEFPQVGTEEVWNFFKLIRSLSDKFLRRKRLHVALSGHAVDVLAYLSNEEYFKLIQERVDYFHLMAYDLFEYSAATKDIGMHAALQDKCTVHDTRGDCGYSYWPHRFQNQKWVVQLYTGKLHGINCLVGLPTYGRSYTTDGTHITPGNAAEGPGKEGYNTEERGLLSYPEICQRLNGEPGIPYSEWTRVFDDNQQSIYAYHQDQWVGYNDPESNRLKMQSARRFLVAGFFMWDVSLDDVTGKGCHGKPFPLTRAVALEVGLTVNTRLDIRSNEDDNDEDDSEDGDVDWFDFEPLTRPPTTTPKLRVCFWDLSKIGENTYMCGGAASITASLFTLLISIICVYLSA